MNIVPSSTIHLLKNVPLNNTYDETIRFASKAQQVAYFARGELHVQSFTNQSYQRYDRGVLRIQALADDLYQCNYMCFQNTGHSSEPKWFYAFVTSVDYVNENCTNISYEIDVMQTYLFDVEVGMCFVEREHTFRDGIGDNIVEENVALGEYVFEDYNDIDTKFPPTQEDPGRFNRYCVVIMTCTVYTDAGNVLANVYDNVVQGATLYAFAYDDDHIGELQTFIQGYTQVPEEIVAMYMIPMALIGEIPSNHIIGHGRTGIERNCVASALSPSKSTTPSTFGNFVPKNNKLYTYPFTYYHVDNGSGDELRLRYEFFQDGKPTIQLHGTLTPPVQIVCVPASYKGVPDKIPLGPYHGLYTQAITLENYPMCSWSTDFYSTWISQNLVPMGLNIVSKALPAISMSSSATELIHGASVKNSIGLPYWKNIRTTNDVTSKNTSFSPTEKFSSAAQIASDLYSAHIHSDDIRGAKFCANANFATYNHTFHVGRARITEQYARIIDNYFNMFGYAVRRVKVPIVFNRNETVRPHWNFVKTANCVLSKSNCPTDVANAIISIFNNGITFWENADEIGDYSLDNRPIA